jgi:uncharacterized protein YbgA (DUF1722 family)/uncharacterized protein YbbK (DUF523 family)
MEQAEIHVGISACLLGQKVRFDGGHKRDAFITDLLGQFVKFLPVCPEVELGLGTPRETLHLVNLGGQIRLVTAQTGVDYTAEMRRYAAERVEQLASHGLSGYILKKGSPSCGMERVKVFGRAGAPAKNGRGLFAQALIERFPLLPVEEEGRLQDACLRENFIVRIFAFHRLQRLFSNQWKIADLVTFHTAEKLLLMAHTPAAYAELGRLVGAGKGKNRKELAARYQEVYMQALAVPAKPRRHVNVLQHIAGYFKTVLDSSEKAELRGLIEDYRHGVVPLIVPLTLIKHFVRRYQVEYLAGQRYLDPHPKEMMLRNHV